MSEHTQKMKLVRDLMAKRHLDAVLLQRVGNFAWLTCGAASYVNTAVTNGESSLLITSKKQHLISNNIEATRLDKEEKLKAQGWNFQVSPWYESNNAVADLTRGLQLGVDGCYPKALDISADLTHLRVNLSPEEDKRFRLLGSLCAQAMNAASRSVKPGQTEGEIAGLLAKETESRGVQVIVNLIATDERIFNYRHPLPADKKLRKYAMLILCGRKYGLVCSVTRLIHFGKLPDEIRRKADAVARIDATFIAATRPGQTLGEIFNRAVQAYSTQGYPDEWKLHHQGGSAGYEPREFVATPGLAELVSAGQVYAWNPSITGAKSEDTILVGKKSNEVLTEMADWPMILVEMDGQTILRPDVLVIT